ncbi:MAG: hypothetical protein AAF907_02325, partial [Planctomycetota bacterium]
MFARRSLVLTLFVLCGAAAPGVAEAQLTIRQVEWGFGGRALAGSFTPVSIELDNPTSEAFDGEVRLYRADYLGNRRGAVLKEQLYISPTNRKRVQFYVIPLSNRETWRLEAVPEGGTTDEGLSETLPAPGFSNPQGPTVVLLTPQDDFTSRTPGLPRMNEEIFPIRPEATDGLAGVVLDHAPEWGEPRQDSFLAWLNAGGVVHLLVSPDGDPVRFGGALTVLNDPSSRFPVGRGLVFRHARQAGDVTKSFVKDALTADPTFAGMSTEDFQFEERRLKQAGLAINFDPTRLEDEILPTLRRMVRPEHNWGLIHILCLAYVAAIFPGVFLVGRERRGYPATLGLLIAVTLMFGVALRTVGRRGYGESLSVRTTALVKALPPGPGSEKGVVEVTQWADAFVTNGGDYTFAVPGDAALYSTGQAAEPVKGTIDNGIGDNGVVGSLTADVPPFSSRAFVAKARRNEPAPPVQLLAGSAGTTSDGSGIRLNGLRVQIPEEI